MASLTLTHQVSVDQAGGVVTKIFVQRARSEPEREWRALLLLDELAPGLAPRPIRADLSASSPVIEMSALPGAPLGGGPLSAAQQQALVQAIQRLWQAVPADRIRPFPGEAGNEAQLRAVLSARLTTGPEVSDDPVVAAALREGVNWLAVASDGASHPARPVFGQGDSNLANFLWDGERVRIVDFEDSGRSDRAFELAVLVEHLSAWQEAGLDADRFVAEFDLSATETARLADFRRLAALHWLLMLRPGGGARRRNPPGTQRRQAERLLGLL